MYRYSAPQKGRFREHWQWSVEAIGSADPARRRRADPALPRRCSSAVGIHRVELRLNSIGDAACRPAYVALLEAWLDAHEDVLDEEAQLKRAHEPAAGVRRQEPAAAGGARRGAADRRPSLRRLPRTPRRAAAVRSRPMASPTPSTRARARARLLLTHDLRVRPHRARADDLRRRPLRRAGRADRRAADAGDRLRRRASTGSRSPRAPRVSRRVPRGIEVFFVLDGAPRDAILPLLAALRAGGLACDIDYAGRSLKGQETQAQPQRRAHGRDRRTAGTARDPPRRGEPERARLARGARASSG